jgi:hypothetical protein
MKTDKIHLKASGGRKIIVDSRRAGVDIVVNIFYPVYGMEPLFGLADSPLLSLLNSYCYYFYSVYIVEPLLDLTDPPLLSLLNILFWLQS